MTIRGSQWFTIEDSTSRARNVLAQRLDFLECEKKAIDALVEKTDDMLAKSRQSDHNDDSPTDCEGQANAREPELPDYEARSWSPKPHEAGPTRTEWEKEFVKLLRVWDASGLSSEATHARSKLDSWAEIRDESPEVDLKPEKELPSIRDLLALLTEVLVTARKHCPKKQPPVPDKRGRPSLSETEREQRKKILDEWLRASDTGISQKEFCQDKGMPLKELIKIVNYFSTDVRRNQTP